MIDDFRLTIDYCISRGERREQTEDKKQYAVGRRQDEAKGQRA